MEVELKFQSQSAPSSNFKLKEVEKNRKRKKDKTNCCVPQCKSIGFKTPNVSFHKFPNIKNIVRKETADGQKVIVNCRQEWIRLLRIEKKISKRMCVCSKHFELDTFTFPPEKCQRPRLKMSAVPSLFLPSTCSPSKMQQKERKSAKRLARYNKKIRIYQENFKKTAMHTNDTTEQGSVCNDLPLKLIQSVPLSHINLVVPAETTTSNHLHFTFKSGKSIRTALTSQNNLLSSMESAGNILDSNNLENAQEKELSKNHTEFMKSNFNDFEQIDYVTHAKAFCAAKTLLHYMINQNDVNNDDINFILNLTKKIESNLSKENETPSENS